MIYLDNSATTKPCKQALEAMNHAAEEEFFNPSSLYAPSMGASRLLKQASSALLAAMGWREDEFSVIYTSGGTEADNLAILGAMHNLRKRQGHFITSAVEHPAVLKAMEAVAAQGHEVTILPVDELGVVHTDDLRSALQENTTLVSIMHVNNETGAIQPIEELAALTEELAPNALFHTDGVQSFLHLPLVSQHVDMYSVSAHKFHGLRGVGALIRRKSARILPIIYGGGQQENLRSGTENVPAIAGMAAAVTAYPKAQETMAQHKEMLYQGVINGVEGAMLNGPKDGAPHILNISFPLRAEVLLHALEAEGIYVSTGSACSALTRRPSGTLAAMGLSKERIQGAIRFSLSHETTTQDIQTTTQAVTRLVAELRTFRRK